jgi:hypothetical protein
LKNKVFGQRTNEEEEESSFSSLGGHAAASEDDGPNNSKNKKEGKKEEVSEESFLSKLRSMIESYNPEEELLQLALSSSEGDDEDPATLDDLKAMNDLVKEVIDQISRNMETLSEIFSKNLVALTTFRLGRITCNWMKNARMQRGNVVNISLLIKSRAASPN